MDYNYRKSIRLEGFDTLQLRDVLVFTEKQSEGWKLRLVVHMDTAEANVQYSGKIDLQVSPLIIDHSYKIKISHADAFVSFFYICCLIIEIYYKKSLVITSTLY